MDTEAVAAAVDETAALLRADGADLVLVDANPKTARIEVRLELAGVECLECVVPPDMLAQIVTTDLQKRVRGEFELVLDDPRRALDAP
jgi:Fe-S cluster biogenesis protein NfuA